MTIKNKKTRRFLLTISPYYKKLLAEAALERQCSQSEILRIALHEHLLKGHPKGDSNDA